MKGFKIEFEFNKKDGFNKEVLKEDIRKLINNEKYRVVDIWCILNKKVYVPDYPALYYINECIMELDCSDDIDAEQVYCEVERLIRNESNKENSLFFVYSMKQEEINIKRDLTDWKKCKDIKVFVTGVAGQLGHEVMNRLYECGYSGIGTDIAEEYQGIQDGSPVTKMPYVSMNIIDTENTKKIISEIDPDVVIHCAAWNAVDQAEDKTKTAIVRATNVDGTQSIADVCTKLGCKMVYISTDYVFDGTGEEPWDPDSKEYHALNVYGQTKLEGELAVSQTMDKYFIVRTSWAYGMSGKNFVKTILDIGEKYDVIHVVHDQVGTPTYMKDLANLIVDMIATEKYGYYNATNEGGYISWYDFACEIVKQTGLQTKVLPANSEEYGINRAARPANSRLDKSKLTENGFKLLPNWKDALGRYLEELKKRKDSEQFEYGVE